MTRDFTLGSMFPIQGHRLKTCAALPKKYQIQTLALGSVTLTYPGMFFRGLLRATRVRLWWNICVHGIARAPPRQHSDVRFDHFRPGIWCCTAAGGHHPSRGGIRSSECLPRECYVAEYRTLLAIYWTASLDMVSCQVRLPVARASQNTLSAHRSEHRHLHPCGRNNYATCKSSRGPRFPARPRAKPVMKSALSLVRAREDNENAGKVS